MYAVWLRMDEFCLGDERLTRFHHAMLVELSEHL